MKKFLCFLAIASVLSLAGFSKGPVAQGKTHSCLGNYVVDKAVKPISVDGKELETFIVNYENSDLNVRIGIDRSDKKCTRYIVLSDDLEIQYMCNGKYFGVQRLNKRYQDDGLSTSELSLDREEYYHQKVITQSVTSEKDHLKLISVYFPRLVKNYEKVFAFK
ncbi:MAG TPA: hypothetical protein ENH59_08690 [Bacteroidetes bacterium]|nr:hypothetical protein [Bacteroidota bacterium]